MMQSIKILHLQIFILNSKCNQCYGTEMMVIVGKLKAFGVQYKNLYKIPKETKQLDSEKLI